MAQMLSAGSRTAKVADNGNQEDNGNQDDWRGNEDEYVDGEDTADEDDSADEEDDGSKDSPMTQAPSQSRGSNSIPDHWIQPATPPSWMNVTEQSSDFPTLLGSNHPSPPMPGLGSDRGEYTPFEDPFLSSLYPGSEKDFFGMVPEATSTDAMCLTYSELTPSSPSLFSWISTQRIILTAYR